MNQESFKLLQRVILKVFKGEFELSAHMLGANLKTTLYKRLEKGEHMTCKNENHCLALCCCAHELQSCTSHSMHG